MGITVKTQGKQLIKPISVGNKWMFALYILITVYKKHLIIQIIVQLLYACVCTEYIRINYSIVSVGESNMWNKIPIIQSKVIFSSRRLKVYHNCYK